jgi:UBX domain-containing protein 1
VREADGAEIHLDMEDHRSEEFVPPKPAYVLYNEGYKLGNPTPSITTNASESQIKNDEDQAKKSLNTNENAPTTNIQIRLSDGSK